MHHPVAHFDIEYTGFIAADGTAQGPLPEIAADRERMIALYRAMVRTRVFDEKAVALQRTGRLGTYASSLGQEAVAVGVGAAMAPADILVPAFREHGTQLWRGVTPLELFLYWGGDERGNDFAVPRRDFPVSIPVGSHAPHAAGAALAMRLRHEPQAVVCVLGDGATSKGEFAESLNMTGVWDAPAVFVVANNQWAISVRRSEQSHAGTLAQKAIAAGIPGEQVDGNDVVAVHDVLTRALARARAGEGGAVVEALTYRLADHTTADDASRYREDAEVSAHWAEEPVARLRRYLEAQSWWGKEDETALAEEVHGEIEAAAEAYLATPPEPPEAIFDHLYARLPESLAAQREAVRAAEGSDG